ncbi:MAG TPA: 12-oxophytodienoate reductase, partial [Polyangiaceae bacterium]|nr:12-oxophytodienoate reductase [Polyangiaceae bacterium]
MTTAWQPWQLGTLTVPNRIVLAPMKTALGGADGKATPKHVAYYRRRAQGAVGLIITEPLYVDSRG